MSMDQREVDKLQVPYLNLDAYLKYLHYLGNE
jgi:hypothetical protein